MNSSAQPLTRAACNRRQSVATGAGEHRPHTFAAPKNGMAHGVEHGLGNGGLAGKSLFRCVSICPRRVSNSSIVGVVNVEVFQFAVAIELLHLELSLLQLVLT